MDRLVKAKFVISVSFFEAIRICMKPGLIISLVLLAIASPSYGAEARSYFSDGAGTAGDSFPGAEGAGWKGPWQATALLHDTTFLTPANDWPTGLLESIVQVGDSIPFGEGSSSHLEIVHAGGSEGAQGVTLVRPFVLDPQEPYRVSFKIRVDALSGNTTPANSFFLRLAATGGEVGKTGTTGSTSWWIQVSPEQGREWLFVTNHQGGSHDEFTFVPSGMKMEPGKIYHFTIQTTPDQKSYTITLSDGENSVTKGPLGFRDSARPLHLDYLSFGSIAQRNVSLRYSLGEISVERGSTE